MLMFARQLIPLDRDMKAGEWKKRDAIALHECTVGIIGVGNTGRATIRRAKAFGPRILACDIETIPQEFIEETGMEVATQEEVLRESDFVSLHSTLNPTSNRMIGEKELAMMKPTAVIINTARGPLIQEAALVKALKEKTIAGAALDVFEVEPLPESSLLRTFDNVFLAPHNANSSFAARDRVNKLTVGYCLEELAKYV